MNVCREKYIYFHILCNVHKVIRINFSHLSAETENVKSICMKAKEVLKWILSYL